MKGLLVLGMKIAVLFLILSGRGYTQEVQALLEGPEDPVHVGDVARLELTVWPRDKMELKTLKNLEGRRLGSSLAILTLSSLKVSENNEQALVAKVYGVFLTSDELPEMIDLGDQKVKLLKRSMEVSGEVSQIKKLHIFTLKNYQQMNWYLTLFSILVLAAIVGLFLKKKFAAKKILLEQRRKADFWKTKLRAAQTREEIEELYALRSQWGQSLNLTGPSYTKFCESVEKIQYKKDWSTEESEKVNVALNNLRRVIET